LDIIKEFVQANMCVSLCSVEVLKNKGTLNISMLLLCQELYKAIRPHFSLTSWSRHQSVS